MNSLLNREDVIHYSARTFLKKTGWVLIAGEYPNGSDDELHSLRIMDPYFSRDQSPDHRRHSLNKLVPDLVAYKDSEFLIVEMKPKYSKADEEKLVELINERSSDLINYLELFLERYLPALKIDVNKCKLTPALGFSALSAYTSRVGFSYILVNGLESAQLLRN